MPAKGTSKVTERQRRILAAAKAGGIAIGKAAAAAGVSRNTATKVLQDPGTRNLFREIKAAHTVELTGLYGLILKTLAEDLVSAQNESTRARLRDEGLKVLALGEALGVSGESGSSAAGGTGMTLGDILVRVSHTHPSGSPAPTHANGGAAS